MKRIKTAIVTFSIISLYLIAVFIRQNQLLNRYDVTDSMVDMDGVINYRGYEISINSADIWGIDDYMEMAGKRDVNLDTDLVKQEVYFPGMDSVIIECNIHFKKITDDVSVFDVINFELQQNLYFQAVEPNLTMYYNGTFEIDLKKGEECDYRLILQANENMVNSDKWKKRGSLDYCLMLSSYPEKKGFRLNSMNNMVNDSRPNNDTSNDVETEYDDKSKEDNIELYSGEAYITDYTSRHYYADILADNMNVMSADVYYDRYARVDSGIYDISDLDKVWLGYTKILDFKCKQIESIEELKASPFYYEIGFESDDYKDDYWVDFDTYELRSCGRDDEELLYKYFMIYEVIQNIDPQYARKICVPCYSELFAGNANDDNYLSTGMVYFYTPKENDECCTVSRGTYVLWPGEKMEFVVIYAYAYKESYVDWEEKSKAGIVLGVSPSGGQIRTMFKFDNNQEWMLPNEIMQ